MEKMDKSGLRLEVSHFQTSVYCSVSQGLLLNLVPAVKAVSPEREKGQVEAPTLESQPKGFTPSQRQQQFPDDYDDGNIWHRCSNLAAN